MIIGMRGKKLKRDIALNATLSFFVTFGVMWVVRKAGFVFAPAALGLFLLSRRVIETISNFLQLGTSQTLRRYLPMNESASTQLLYIMVGLSIFAVVAIIFIVGLVGGLETWASLVFADNLASVSLMFWVGMMALAMVLHYFATSTLLAFRWIIAANLVQLLNSSVWLLVGMWWWKTNTTIEALIRFQAVATATLSVLVMMIVIVLLTARISRSSAGPIPWRNYQGILIESLTYGLPRGVSPFLEVSLFLLGPWLIRHDVEEVGYLIISFFFLRIGRTIIQPVAMIIGVAMAKLVGQKDETALKQGASLLLGTMLYGGCLLLSVVYPWIRFLLQVWLGDVILAQKVYGYVVVIMLAMLPVLVFQGLREPIEMIWKQPRNLYTLSCSIFFLVLCFYATKTFLPASTSILYGYVGALGLSGIMSVAWLKNYLNPFSYFGVGKILATSLFVLLLNWLVAGWLHSASLWLNVVGFIFAGGLSVTLAVAFSSYQPSPFVKEAVQFFRPGFAHSRLWPGQVNP